MKTLITLICLALNLAFFQTVPSFAANISFDSYPVSSNFPVDTRIESGFLITGSLPFFIGDGANFCIPQCPENNTHYLLSQWGSTISLRLVSSGTFSATSFQYAEQQIGLPFVPRIDVVGHLLNGEATTASFFVDGINDGSGPLNDFQTAFLPDGFANLIYIEFLVPDSSNFSLDNIQVSPIPTPTSILLIAFGIFVILLLRLKMVPST